MTHKRINPQRLHKPLNYYHSVEVDSGCKTIYLAGQTAVKTDGSTPNGIKAQAEIVFENLQIVLSESGYSLKEVVFMKSFLVNRADRDGYQEVRARFWGEIKPASTFLIISGLAKPEYLLEVECIAAKKA